MNILILIIGIILPPVGAGLKVGITTHFWINLILTILGYIPGIIHFLWLMVTDKQPAP